MRPNSFIKKKGLLAFKILVLSTLLSSCSNSGELEYQPVGERFTNKQLGQNVSLVILDFPDNRPPVKGFAYSNKLATKPKKNLVGILFGAYNIRIRKLHSNQMISHDVTEAFRNLFSANGFNVIRYNENSGSSPLPDERLEVKGQINEFWMSGYPGGRGTSPSMEATIDIDLTIIDTKNQRTIWTGKIENYQKIGPNKGIFTGTNKIFLFLNTVFSDAVEQAWIEYGMLNALRALDKKDLLKQVSQHIKN